MKSVIFIFLLLAECSTLQGQHLFTTPITASDVTNFWAAFDEFEKDTTKNPFEHYLAVGTAGLADMNMQMIGGARKLKEHVLRRIDFYRQARSVSPAWQEYTDKINYVTQQLTARVPEMKFPAVYLVIGIENCGGNLSGNGILIGLETLCYAPGTDPMGMNRSMDNLPECIAEIIAWHNITGFTENNLMEHCLAGGSAEFFAREATRDLRIKMPSWKMRALYGEAHHSELWKAFVADRNNAKFGNWFWVNEADRPHDVGIWIGYTIVQSYYQDHKNDPEVMKDLLNIALLRKYAEEVMVKKSID